MKGTKRRFGTRVQFKQFKHFVNLRAQCVLHTAVIAVSRKTIHISYNGIGIMNTTNGTHMSFTTLCTKSYDYDYDYQMTKQVHKKKLKNVQSTGTLNTS